MNVDAILERKPGVVLVDELAHTNVPGSKNAKRYQDVEEIRDAGIHVISTLNVQHLESLYEIVERATGVKVRERIPDGILSEADQLVNVDLSTEDLRERLKDGKVYTTERIELALDQFFKRTNLEQLRELTLRELAAQIDSRRRDPLAEQVPPAPDQVAVCLSSKGPNSEALLRYASRLAGRLNRNWYAVYVQTSSELPTVIDAETQRTVVDTLALAHQLGATVFTYKGDDVVKTILQFANEYRVGHIVLGASGRRLSLWERLRGKASIVDRLIQDGQGLNVVIVNTRALGEINAAASAESHVAPHVAEESFAREEPLRGADSVALETGTVARVESQPMISADQVLIWEGQIEKEDALRALLKLCCRSEPKVNEEIAWEKVMARERQGATFVGEGVAIPHARIDELDHPVMAIGVPRTGINDAETRTTIQIMILLLTPASDANAHVRVLGEVTRMVQESQWRKGVIEARSAQEIDRILGEWQGLWTPPAR